VGKEKEKRIEKGRMGKDKTHKDLLK